MLQPVGNKGPLADRTLIIAPLPLSLKSCDLIHSIVAPGGIRQIHFAPLPGSQFQVAVITFITAAGATAYKKYFDGNGFFLSIRQKDNSEEGLLGRDGETRTKVMQTGPEGRGVKKVFLIKKHMVSVCVRFWGKDMDGGFLPDDHRLRLEVENELTKWFALDDTWFTDLDEEVRKKGATRVLKVMDAVDVVTAQLKNCKFSRKDNVGGGCVCISRP